MGGKRSVCYQGSNINIRLEDEGGRGGEEGGGEEGAGAEGDETG